ncbi:MAG TPA: shikimate dehydrogenase [Candidatus Nealsonbacteria bacterium]|uniref:shikimate dehydrogenase (NADP(+)) n=1 Tax=marine sediment metagenome TaxID=412755 RepID=A0A0F9VCF2_9ZZZZ|nr:shikimate dehydrogenase [Candidatus Nealsonbacteria bacterium]HEB46528.1 shikimate dehydrogenase [Candidatus Nealsonbacteria bacterium]
MYYSALLGKPVDHSISPALFEMLAETASLEYAHLKIEVESLSELKTSLSSLNNLKFRGVNITLPYKISVIKYLDKIDGAARKIGAVNTVVFKNNKFIGHNTDAKGAILAIEKKLKKVGGNDKIVVLGAGGAARAIIYKLYKRCKNITILNINIKQANKVSDDISVKSNKKINAVKLNNENIEKFLRKSNIIINATPVGMFPKSNEEIVNQKIFNKIGDLKGKYFFDAIFNPYKTKFLLDAEKKGGKVCSGLDMMIYQAISAFKLWVGHDLKKVNIKLIEKRLIKILQKF